jgi:predicted RNase H-like nuclease
MVVGFDGTPGGWIGIALDDDGHFAGDFVIKRINSNFADVKTADVITVDVPIGFCPREADKLARRFIGGERGRSVFTVPEEAVLVAALKTVPFRRGRGMRRG